MKPLTTEDHDRWNALIGLCLRDVPPKPLAIRRAAKRCRAVRGDRSLGASMPEGHCHRESCFARLVSDGEGFDGDDAAFWALKRFAEACWAVLADMPEPVTPKPKKRPRRGRTGAFRARPQRAGKPVGAQKPRWMSRADLNN